MSKVVIFLVIVCIIAAAPGNSAQDSAQAYFTIGQRTLLIGEPVSLLLTVDVPAGAIVTLPQFPEHWPPLMVREAGEVTVSSHNGRDIYQQSLIVVVWDTGDFQTASVTIEYQLSGLIQQIQVQPAVFSVQSVLNPDDLNLRPPRPPITLFYLSPWVVMAAIVGTFAGCYYAWRTRRRWRGIWATSPKTERLHAAARAALDGLKQLRERKKSPIKAYALTGNLLRGYIQGRFAVPAEELTTEELMVRLSQGEPLTERRQRELVYLLEQADLVKFARFQPLPHSAEKMMDVAQRWILAVEQDHNEVAE
jgi:hypothetical protein